MQLAVDRAAAGDFPGAVTVLQQVLQADPQHRGAATQLAEIEISHGEFGTAMARVLRVLRHAPRDADALNALARACLLSGRLDEALVHGRRAVAADPGAVGPRVQLGRVLLRLGQHDAARGVIAPVLAASGRADSSIGLAHGLLGEILDAEGDPAATAHYRRAVELRPNEPQMHVSHAVALLREGRLMEGWEEYDWRRFTIPLLRQALPLPEELRWTGRQELRGHTIVLSDEQGVGDAIQFFRFLPMVAARGPARLIHVAFPALLPMFRAAAPFAEVLPELPFGTTLQFHCTTMSLARAFGIRLDNIPARVPYLYADPVRVQAWTSALAGEAGSAGPAGPRVGLVWSGNPTHLNDHLRSIPAGEMLRLTGMVPARWFCLQPEIRPGDAAAVAACAGLVRIADGFKDYADTAAVIAGLDLVICVDTSVAHLAGAMGKPVWVLLPRVADWRWLTGRDDSPWYPTARLFRAGPDGWPGVMARVAEALRGFGG